MPRTDRDLADPPDRRRAGFRPALRALALIVLAVVAIVSDNWWILLGLVALPLVFWSATRRNPLRLFPALRRTWFFLAMLIVTFVLFPPPGEDVLVTIGGRQLDLAGLLQGVKMSLRILSIVLASVVVRETGRPGDLLTGLRQLGLPAAVGQTIEGTLVLLGGREGRRRGERRRSGRRGGGSGSGGGPESPEDEQQPRRSGFRALLAARPRVIARLGSAFASSIQESTAALEGLTTAAGPQHQVSEGAVVITALTVMAMSIKFMKIMPGIPILSGHKQLVIIPLYVVAADLVKSRWAATWMGASLGVVSFLFGEGRFGVLEIAKYLTSGLVLDLLWPLLRRRRSVLLFGLAGVLMGVAWIASTLLAALIVGAPPLFYAVIAATSISQLAFSLCSGPVSVGLLRGIGQTGIEVRAEEARGGIAGHRGDAGDEIQPEPRQPSRGRSLMPRGTGGNRLRRGKAFQEQELEVSAIRLLPELNVVKVGATSVVEHEDRNVLASVVEEIAEASRSYQLLISTGGGERHRHAFEIGVDLRMPVGVLAVLGAMSPNQNALILQALLAPYGGIRISAEHFDEIPVYLSAGAIPITSGMPTYNYWEHPPRKGELPEHDTDVGAYLMADTFGCRKVIFVKDVDGVYTADPASDASAELLTDVTVDELRDLPSLPFDPPVLDFLASARTVRSIQVINGHKPGQLTAALAGEPVGTIVRSAHE